MPYDTVVVADFADLECEASAKSVAVCAMREQQPGRNARYTSLS
jgi:hypothetical protein